jgi:hypothetical protein
MAGTRSRAIERIPGDPRQANILAGDRLCSGTIVAELQHVGAVARAGTIYGP